MYRRRIVKLKDLVEEKWVTQEDGDDYKENRKAFLESLSKFGEITEFIYRSGDMQEVAKRVSDIVEMAETVTLKETDDWYDQVSVKRNMKSLKEASKHFVKTAKEVHGLQQRLESSFEDVATTLNKYYALSEGTELSESVINEAIKFDEDKMRDLIQSDKFLTHIWRREYARKGEKDQLVGMHRMFQSDVIADPILRKKYLKM